MIPEEVDVTQFVESGEYRPDSCEGHLDRLVKVAPRHLDYKSDPALRKALLQWANETKFDLPSFDSLAIPHYRYTYFATIEPLDVYCTKLADQNMTSLYFRYDKSGHLVDGVQSSSWVQNACDER